MSKKVLIAFECSGVVRRAFRAVGCEAYSNDLQPADDDSEFHILGDAIDAINSQEWDLIIKLAKEIRDFKINIWIIGEGLRKVYLESEIEKYRLNNIKLLPYYDRKYMPAINLFADIHFIAMDKKVEKYGFPSKVYTIMASGKPMIVVSSKDTPIVSFLKDLDAALLVTDHSLSKFKKELLKLHNSIDLRNKLGSNGRQEIIKKYSKKVVINQYVNLFNILT